MFKPLSLSVSLLCVMLGCGGDVSDRPDLGQVSGVVTLDGQPLSDATVSFQPPNGRPSSGTTDASGRYVLTYLNEVKGAVVGPHQVQVTTGRSAVSDDDPSSAKPETLPKKYNAESTLTAEVKKGNNTFDYPLESK